MVYTVSVTYKQLKTWRKKNNYSQSQLAKALRVHVITVSRWETKAREIPSFLHLALKLLELKKGGESKKRVMKKRKEKS